MGRRVLALIAFAVVALTACAGAITGVTFLSDNTLLVCVKDAQSDSHRGGVATEHWKVTSDGGDNPVKSATKVEGGSCPPGEDQYRLVLDRPVTDKRSLSVASDGIGSGSAALSLANSTIVFASPSPTATGSGTTFAQTLASPTASPTAAPTASPSPTAEPTQEPTPTETPRATQQSRQQPTPPPTQAPAPTTPPTLAPTPSPVPTPSPTPTPANLAGNGGFCSGQQGLTCVTGTIRHVSGAPAAGACLTVQTASSCAAVADANGTWRVELINGSITWNFRFFFSGVETTPGQSVSSLTGGTKQMGAFTLSN